MIIRKNRWFLLVVILQITAVRTQEQQQEINERSYDENEWIPITPTSQEDESSIKKATGRVLNLDAPSQKIRPDEDYLRKRQQQQYIRENQKNFHQKPPPRQIYALSQELSAPPLQQTPNFYEINALPSTSPTSYQIPFNESFYLSLNPDNINHQILDAIKNNPHVGKGQEENETIQLLYVPLENLKQPQKESKENLESTEQVSKEILLRPIQYVPTQLGQNSVPAQQPPRQQTIRLVQPNLSQGSVQQTRLQGQRQGLPQIINQQVPQRQHQIQQIPLRQEVHLPQELIHQHVPIRQHQAPVRQQQQRIPLRHHPGSLRQEVPSVSDRVPVVRQQVATHERLPPLLSHEIATGPETNPSFSQEVINQGVPQRIPERIPNLNEEAIKHTPGAGPSLAQHPEPQKVQFSSQDAVVSQGSFSKQPDTSPNLNQETFNQAIPIQEQRLPHLSDITFSKTISSIRTPLREQTYYQAATTETPPSSGPEKVSLSVQSVTSSPPREEIVQTLTHDVLPEQKLQTRPPKHEPIRHRDQISRQSTTTQAPSKQYSQPQQQQQQQQRVVISNRNHQLFQSYPENPKQNRLQTIEQEFLRQALAAHKLQQQIQLIEPIVTTPKPKKKKAHQPPLALYMESQESARVDDVLNMLKHAKSITVQDTVGPDSPEVFVGPSNLDPQGYTKFALPYLSNVASNNRIERKVDQLPFFVAPLSYKTPEGYSKIPLPSPHVGSVVVATRENSTPLPQILQNQVPYQYQQEAFDSTPRPRPIQSFSTLAFETTPSYPIKTTQAPQRYNYNQDLYQPDNIFSTPQKPTPEFNNFNPFTSPEPTQNYYTPTPKTKASYNNIFTSPAVDTLNQFDLDQINQFINGNTELPSTTTRYQETTPKQVYQNFEATFSTTTPRLQETTPKQIYEEITTTPRSKRVRQRVTPTRTTTPPTTPGYNSKYTVLEHFHIGTTTTTPKYTTAEVETIPANVYKLENVPANQQQFVEQSQVNQQQFGNRPQVSQTQVESQQLNQQQFNQETFNQPQYNQEQSFSQLPNQQQFDQSGLFDDIRYTNQQQSEQNKYNQQQSEQNKYNQQQQQLLDSQLANQQQVVNPPQYEDQLRQYAPNQQHTLNQAQYPQEPIEQPPNQHILNQNLMDQQILRGQIEQTTQNIYRTQEQGHRFLPSLINNLQGPELANLDQSVRPLLVPNLLVPTTEKLVPQGKGTEKFEYSSTEPTSTTTKRTRGRQRAHITQGTTTPSSRRVVNRRRPTHRTRTTTTEHFDNHYDTTTKKQLVRQRFRTRGRPLQTTDYGATERVLSTSSEANYKEPEVTNGFAAEPQSYMQFERDNDQQVITIKPSSNEITSKEYQQFADEIKAQQQQQEQQLAQEQLEQQQRKETIQKQQEQEEYRPVVDIQITHPLIKNTNKIAKQDRLAAGVLRNDDQTSKSTRPRTRTRSRTRLTTTPRPITTTPITTTTTRAPPTSSTQQLEENDEEDEFYGFIRTPSYSKPATQPAIQRYTYQNTESPIIRLYNDDEVAPSNPVHFIGEIRPKYSTSETVEPVTTTAAVTTTPTTTELPRTKGRARIRLTTRPTSTDKPAVNRGRTRGRNHFKLPETAKSEEEDQEPNYPPTYLQVRATTKSPSFQITVHPEDEDQQSYSSVTVQKIVNPKDEEEVYYSASTGVDDQEPHSSFTSSKIVTPWGESLNLIQDKELVVDSSESTPEVETTTETIETTTKKTGRRRGVWKLVRHRPIEDHFEVAESQNYQSVLNSFEEIRKITPRFSYNFTSNAGTTSSTTTTVPTTTEGEGIMDTLYNMFSFAEEPSRKEKEDEITTTTTYPTFPDEITESFETSTYEIMKEISKEPELQTTTVIPTTPTTVKTTTTPPPITTYVPITTTTPTTTTAITQSVSTTPIVTTTSSTSTPSTTTAKHYEVEPWNMRAVKTSTSTEVSHETEICYRGKCVKTFKKL